MRICNKPMLVLILLFTTWIPSLHGATMDEYVGRWKGDVSLVSPNESEIINLTIVLQNNNGIIAGTVSDNQTGTPQPFVGNINNGVLDFQFPNMDPDNPDCTNWNLPAQATLDSSAKTMHLTASGIICGSGGGKYATVEGSLRKRESSLQPILSILLKNKGVDWFFAGSDIGGKHAWYGTTTLDASGALLDGTLNSSSGSTYAFISGQLSTSSTGEVSGSLTDSDSTTTAFSMQLNGNKNIMAGKGKAVGESENGLFIFVKKSTDAQPTDLSDQWFLAYSDLVANRTCGGTITFTGLSGLESWRVPNGTVECTDGTSHSIQGSTLHAFFVNDSLHTVGPGNVSGKFMEPDNQGRETFVQMELNVPEKIMAGYGKGVSDNENGLYVFIKETTNANIADLAGDWVVSNSDLFGNKTWQGVFSFNSSGQLTSGSLTSTNGDNWSFTSGTLTVDASGQVTGTVTDTGNGTTEFVLQLNEHKDFMTGPGFSTSDQDNGLFVFVKK